MKRNLLFALIIVLFLPHFNLAKADFNDVAKEHPHYEAIQYLKENGVIDGYADGSFKPDHEVNRAEASKMLLLGANIPVAEIEGAPTIFPDVPHTIWYAKYVWEAQKRDIVEGHPNGLFSPGNPINLVEFLKILLKTHEVDLEKPEHSPYADVPLESWYALYANTAKALNLLDALSKEKIYPAQAMTRGEMAQIIYRLKTGYHEGVASYYGKGFEGSNTASGELLSNKAFVAAHKRLPFDSWIRVTHLDNGKSVDVRIIDRGPYTDGRVVDLSQAAYEALAPLSTGIARVSVKPISNPDESCESSDSASISKNGFPFITLNEPLSTVYLEGEEIVLKGWVEGEASKVTGFLLNAAGQQYTSSSPVLEGHFKVRFYAPKTGEFKVGLLPGESGDSSIYSLQVLSGNCLENHIETQNPAPSAFSLQQKQGDLTFHWNKGEYNLFRLVFKQGQIQKEFFVRDPSFIPPYASFADFKEGKVTLTLQGISLHDPLILAEKRSLHWSLPNTIDFYGSTHHPYIFNDKELNSLTLPDAFTPHSSVQMSANALTPIQEKAWIIFPDGQIKAFPLNANGAAVQTNEYGVRVFPSETALSLDFSPSGNQTHFIEWNSASGVAAMNVPLYPEGVFPLLPNPTDFPQKTVDLGGNFQDLRQSFLTLVNQDRADHNLSPLDLNDPLSQLAQARAQDMVENNYFSHWNAQGQSVNELRQDFGIRQVVSENLAQENTLLLAQYGLMQSAIHRVNILDPEWTRAGFDIAKNEDGSYIFVQIFSADPVDLNDLPHLREKLLSTLNKNRSIPLALKEDLTTQAQAWSQRMVEEDFFGLQAENGDLLMDSLESFRLKNAIGTHLMGNSSFEGILEQAEKNIELQSGQWKEVGMGLAQDAFGVIKVSLVYID